MSLLLDPDMLEVGNGGMTNDEYIVHFSIWAISKVTTSQLTIHLKMLIALKNYVMLAGSSPHWL